jgi:hypothetical protein
MAGWHSPRDSDFDDRQCTIELKGQIDTRSGIIHF